MRESLIILSLLLVVGSLGPSVSGAKCGRTEYFKYKFKPTKVYPLEHDDVDNSDARCGEKKCDVMITLFGSDHCHQGSHGFQFSCPSNQNVVNIGSFTPAEYGYKTFYDWKLADAASSPFKIEVCDDDGFFRGKNDHLMTIEHEELRVGCHHHKHNDRHPSHPWMFEYEICCEPLDSADRERGGGGRNQERHSNRGSERERERARERESWRERERERHEEQERERNEWD